MASLRFLGSLLFCVLVSLPAMADTLGFDDIDASAGDVILTSYNGYNFTNFSAYTTVPGFPGFNAGIGSGPNAAYSTDVGSIASASTFDFTGGEFGSGYYDNLQLTIQGMLGGATLYSQTINVSTTGAQAYSFAFTGIDELLFTTSTTENTTDPYFCGSVGCSYFTLDDAQLTADANPPPPPPPPPPPIGVTPEPPTWTLLASGFLGMLLLRRMRFLHS